jgi:hypothetical protein
VPRMPPFLRLTRCEVGPMSQVGSNRIQEVEAPMLLPKPESVLLHSAARHGRIPQKCESFWDRLRDTACRAKKTQSPVVRLRQLVLCIGGGSQSWLADNPTLMERIEAHLRESGDLELDQLVKKYLAEV